MSTPRRRPTSGIRRPQVAGRSRTGPAEDAEDTDGETTHGTLAVDERSTGGAPAAPADGTTGDPATETGEGIPGAGTAGEAEDDPQDAGPDDGSAPRSRRLPLPPAPATRKRTAVLLVVTVLLAAAAAFFGYQWYSTQFTGSATNSALTDVGVTAEVSQQVGEAVTKVYSFDHARLQQSEDAARAMITPEFTPEFERIFGSVRELAPQQQAVVTATIPKSAVAHVDGDRASVYVFVNQVISRQTDGGAPQEGSAAARLRVDAEYLDGRWKIAAMTPA